MGEVTDEIRQDAIESHIIQQLVQSQERTEQHIGEIRKALLGELTENGHDLGLIGRVTNLERSEAVRHRRNMAIISATGVGVITATVSAISNGAWAKLKLLFEFSRHLGD